MSATPTTAAAADWMTPADLAAHLHIGRRRLLQMRLDGQLQAGAHFIDRGNGNLLYDRKAVEQVFRTRTVETYSDS